MFGFDDVWAWGTMLMNFQQEREIEGGKTWNLFSLDNLTLTSCEVSYKPIDILQKRNTKVHKFYGIFDIHALMMQWQCKSWRKCTLTSTNIIHLQTYVLISSKQRPCQFLLVLLDFVVACISNSLSFIKTLFIAQYLNFSLNYCTTFVCLPHSVFLWVNILLQHQSWSVLPWKIIVARLQMSE